MKSLSTVAIFILAALCPVSAFTEEHITIENWTNHADVAEILRIYNEIQRDIKNGKYSENRKDYDVNAVSCAIYPIKQKLIEVSKSGIVRKFTIIQIISHREPLLIERYYEINGVLRFVFTKRGGSEIKIYLNSNGDVVWAVEKDGNEFVRVDSEKGDWETVPSTSKAALEEYNRDEGCPQINKG